MRCLGIVILESVKEGDDGQYYSEMEIGEDGQWKKGVLEDDKLFLNNLFMRYVYVSA